jgi:hypothetical protein
MIDPEVLKKHIIRCADCGDEFIKIQPTQRFCSNVCRQRGYQNKKKIIEAIEAASVEAPKKRDLFAA